MTIEFEFDELKAGNRLPSPSGTALEIIKLLRRDKATAAELAQLVQTDPALSGRILRLANSAAVGARRSVVSIADAIALLGMDAIRQFALSLSLIGDYQTGACEAFDYPAFWARSLAQAAAIQTVTARDRIVPPEEAFVIGLLADIGRLALATAWPDEYSLCISEGSGDGLLMRERERFAIDHDALSLILLADWGFPAVFLDALKQALGGTDTNSNSRIARFAAQLVFSRQLAQYFLAECDYRKSLLPALRAVATEHALDDTLLPAFLELGESQWQDWGKVVGIGTNVREPAPQPTSADPVAPSPALSILLADDDPLTLTQLSTQLTAEGYRVGTCRDSESALMYALENKPDMVITDRDMKPMDGLQLCQALRESAVGKRLYLIMLTASAAEDALVDAFDAGIDDVAVKPPSLRVLAARIRAGQRIIGLQQELARERNEIERYSAELAVANRRLELMANTDMLTALPNRRYAMSRLEQEWANTLRFNRPLSVMVLDLDHFKSINDSLGHDAGDRVLVHIAKLMRDAVRAGDIVCRMGGEEFLVIAPNTDAASAVRSAERIRSVVAKQQPAEPGMRRPITVSIGVAGSLGAKPGWRELIKLADQALYRVKQSGRNGVVAAN